MRKQQVSDKYAQSEVYKLTCPDCNKAYVGQTGRSSIVRFNEHKNAFKTNSQISNFAKHLIEHTHSFSSIHNTMQILQRHNKGAHLNTIQRYHIYAEFTKNNHLNDEHTTFPNKIFDSLLKPHQPTPLPQTFSLSLSELSHQTHQPNSSPTTNARSTIKTQQYKWSSHMENTTRHTHTTMVKSEQLRTVTKLHRTGR